jgi:hypothetical protein
MKRIFFLTFFIFVFQNVQAENLGLSEAYENEIVERIKSVLERKEVKEEVERPICATPIFIEINFNKDRFSAKTAQLLKPYISRPDFGVNPEYTFDTPSGHFKIHYTATGTDAVFQAGVDVNPADGVPDYVNRCADVFDSVWSKEIDGLEYNPPPSDYWYQPNGGDGRYDVYLKEMDPYYLGYTVPESSSVATPIVYTSYIAVRNDYTGCIHEDDLDCLRATAAHEFFHAIQMGYDATEYESENELAKPYWMEMSAVWMEDMVYDDVNDYLGYLSAFFNEPWLSLKSFTSFGDLHPYGSCVWPIFLSEKFDTLIIKDIWEKCAEKQGDNVIEATDEALGERSRESAFEDAFREFTVWNYFTADRALPYLFYSEGDLFYFHGTPAMVKVDAVHKEYPVDVNSIPHPPENLGSNYVVFVPDTALWEGGIKMDFIGDEGAQYVVSAVGYAESGGHSVPFDTTFLINPMTQNGTGGVYDWNLYTQVIMIPAVITRSPNDTFAYEYSADYDSSLHGGGRLPEKDEILQNFPNPFVIEKESDRTYFPFVLKYPSRVRIDILTLSGERIKTIVPKHDSKFAIGKYLEKNLAMPWDGKSENGEYVASGIYLYRFRTDRSTVIKKMAVIR